MSNIETDLENLLPPQAKAALDLAESAAALIGTAIATFKAASSGQSAAQQMANLNAAHQNLLAAKAMFDAAASD